jgi:hypothetical protein
VRSRLFRTAVVWADGEIEDADEINVFAASKSEAKRKARQRWLLTVGAKWPQCVVQDVLIIRPAAPPG